MTDDRAIERLEIEIPGKPALRLLGYGGPERRPRESVVAAFDQELKLAQTLVTGLAVLGRSHGGLPGSQHFAPDMPLVAVVCTIGGLLEERVADLAEGGQSARAAILDAIGSAAVEEVADRCNQLICAMAAPTDYAPDMRTSPGYGSWVLREQALLFEFLQPEEIGVELTERFSMRPRKSVSFVVPLEGGPVGRSAAERCRHCGLEDCPYRHGNSDALFGSIGRSSDR